MKIKKWRHNFSAKRLLNYLPKTSTQQQTKYKKEIDECINAFKVEHRLYNEDQFFIRFFKFPESHPPRIRNTDIKQIGKLFDKNISQKVITSLVSRHQGPDLANNVIRNHIFGNLDLFHRFFYETLLDNQTFLEMVRVATALQFHQSDKDEELLIAQANTLKDRFYEYVARSCKIEQGNTKQKSDKPKEGTE